VWDMWVEGFGVPVGGCWIRFYVRLFGEVSIQCIERRYTHEGTNHQYIVSNFTGSPVRRSQDTHYTFLVIDVGALNTM
jgi:hypothetical protein